MNTSTQNTVNPVGQWMSINAPESYETFILAACLKSEDLWSVLSNVLCQVRKVDGSFETVKFVNDFTSPVKYVLFRAILFFRDIPGTTINVPRAGLEAALKSLLTSDPAAIAGIDEQEVLDLFDELNTNYDKGNIEAILAGTWTTWLSNLRVQQQLLDIKRTGAAADIVEKLDNINSIVSDIKDRVQTEKTTFSVCDVLIQDKAIVERIPLGKNFKGLNDCLGGGFGKKEHALFVVPTGRGKTVLSCQIAADVAMSGKHVLLITTEQHPDQLVPRIISSLTFQMSKTGSGKIEFSKIKDGITRSMYNSFTNEQQQLLSNITNTINPYLHMENWVCSTNEVADISKLLERVNKTLPEGESIEMVILDWIGGAITKGITDSNVKRNVLKQAAKQMHDIAYNYNVACISTTQADKNALGKKRVTGDNIADCKSLHDEAEVAFGLSAVRTSETDDLTGERTSSYSNDQRLFCFKSRKAEGLDIPVKCNFKFQRFDRM